LRGHKIIANLQEKDDMQNEALFPLCKLSREIGYLGRLIL